MTLVVDASVAVKWLVDETDHLNARALLARGEDLLAPDFVLVEVGNVLWKKLRRGEVTEPQAVSGLATLPRLYDRLLPADLLIARALGLATELQHPVYDCLYLACAESAGARLVTADARFALAARKRSTGVVLLSEWADAAP